MSNSKHDHSHSHGQGHTHDHNHAHDHTHTHSHGHHHDHSHDDAATPPSEKPLKHSFLVPAKYPARSALWPQPLEEIHPSVRQRMERTIAAHTKAHAEPFRGVTTDGTIVPGLFKIQPTGLTLQPVIDAARAFLKTLTPDERKAVTFDINALEWRTWSNGHAFLYRHGLCLHDLDEVKRDAILALARATMSASGFQTLRDIMRLNEHIRELTGRPDEYGEWHYFISIFGEPSAEAPWGWQIDGHHLIVNCFILGDQMVMTPTFMGSEPVFAESGRYRGTRVLQNEESRGYELMKTLTPAQQASATISTQIPRQIFTIAPWDNFVLEQKGVGFNDLNHQQKDLLCSLIELYTSRVRPGHAEIDFDTAKQHLRETTFAWAGPCDDVSPFYYRVQSPVVVIEFDHQSGIAFDNEEPTRHHIHTLVRTPNGNDYGRDLLRQHYLNCKH